MTQILLLGANSGADQFSFFKYKIKIKHSSIFSQAFLHQCFLWPKLGLTPGSLQERVVIKKLDSGIANTALNTEPGLVSWVALYNFLHPSEP